MEQNNFKCSGNCLNCQPAQRAYCASQHAYSNMKVLDAMMNIIIAMQGDLKVVSEKIEAMQNNEASIFGIQSEDKPIAQKGDGVVVEPQDSLIKI